MENVHRRKRRKPWERKRQRKERTTSQRNKKTSEEQWTGGSWEQCQNNLGTQKPTLRVGGTMIGTQQIRILRPQRQLKNPNMRLSVTCDSQIWVMSNTSNLFNMNDWILHGELSHLMLISQHAKLLSPTNHPAARGYLVHKDSLLGCAYGTAGRDKVYDQEKRILCSFDETGKPMAIESRNVDCRRPLMAVIEMTDCGRWVCFGHRKGKVSVLIRGQGKRLSSRRHLGGSDDEVGATGERQQNIEQSNSGDHCKEKSSCSSQRPRSDH